MIDSHTLRRNLPILEWEPGNGLFGANSSDFITWNAAGSGPYSQVFLTN